MSLFATDYTDPIAGGGGIDIFMAGSNLYGTPNLLGLPSAVIKPQTWLDFHPPQYLKEIVHWSYARDHYTGECANMRKITHYLIRKGIGETLEAFQERVALADYTPHFAHIVDSLAGMLFGVEVDANRTMGSLGDETKFDTPAGRLWVNADGNRNSYLTLWKVLTTELIGIHDAWIFVDGGDNGQYPKVRLIQAEAVTNWRYDNGVLVEALIREVADKRTSIADDPTKAAAQYLYMTVDGWQRYEKQKASTNPSSQTTANPGDTSTPGREVAVKIDEAGWQYFTINGQRTIPLIPVSLPLKRHVGFQLARKANVIFNKESERDALLRNCSFPLLNVFGSDTQFKKVTDTLRRGGRAIQVQPGGQAHAFIAPSSQPAQELQSALDKKTNDLYITGFREYGGAAQRSQGNAKTALEVRYDVQTGVAAFLQMLKSAIDDAENATLYFVEQTLFPNNRKKWGTAHVERSDDFVPFDINDVLERIRKRYFGDHTPVPIGRTARIEAAKQIVEWDGLPVDEDEIAADIDNAALFAALQTVTSLAPNLPPEAKAEMVVRILASLGYFDSSDEVVGKDGKAKNPLNVDKIRQAAIKLASAPPPTAAPGKGAPDGSTGGGAGPQPPAAPKGEQPPAAPGGKGA